jgi:serine/threonine-protein kinase
MGERRIIGSRFEILEPLGQGGMGTVFRGIDTQTGQAVAIKLLKPEVVANNPGMVARFAREGEALRRLNHPNIVKMLAAIDEDDTHYLVMEYVGGGSLADLLQKGPLSIERVLQIGLEIADALSRAHHLKIIHRDIKPSNVLLAEDGTPRLTDFGIARLDDQSRMTESGQVVGTFAYLSPEACEGRTLDARTDIWAFGVMLYEMLTGQRPFEEDNIAATISAILSKPAPDLLEQHADMPLALAVLIDRMLEKDRDQRISSARQVGAELEAISRGETTPPQARFALSTPTPTLDAPTTIGATPSDTRLPRRRFSRRWVIVAVAAVVLLVIGGLVLLSSVFTLCCAPPPTLTPTVQPAAAGGYTVLVAPFEAIKTEPRDVGRFIADDLKQQLEVNAPYSKIRLQQYDRTIKTDDDARQAAQATGATVVVWGNYTADKITANVQVGATTAFKYNQFPRDVLERTANVRAEMTDETKQSVAPQVLGVMGMLFVADGDSWGFGSALVGLEDAKVENAALVGDNVAVHTQRFFSIYVSDMAGAIQEMDQAISSDANNAILYVLRGEARSRQTFVQTIVKLQTVGDGNDRSIKALWDPARRDAQTAQRLGPDQWAMPYTVFDFSDYPGFIANYNAVIVRRPDDGLAYLLRASAYFQSRQFDLARADIEQSMTLRPDLGFAYALGAILDLRQGRIADAAVQADRVVSTIPQNPTFLRRVIEAISGGADNIFPIGVIFSPLSKLILGQYDDAVKAADPSNIQIVDTMVEDAGVLRGVAYCDLGKNDIADNIYRSSALGIDVLPLLRADVLIKLRKNATAAVVVQHIQDSKQADALAPFAAAVMNGEFGCQDLFNSKKIADIMAKYGNLKAADIAVTLTAAAPTPTTTPETTATAAP